MTEVPKIVYDRLRAALPGQPHPDPDLLTAFAEQALSATERDGILQHLALCGDCRDVIALALPAADGVPSVIADEDSVRTTVLRAGEAGSRKPGLAWPTLRWAALAAGVAVAAAVLLLHPGKLNQATMPSADRQVATTVAPASGAPIASPLADQSAALAKTDEPQAKSESRLSKRLKAERVLTPTPQAEPGILLADNKKDSGQADRPSARARALKFDAHRRGAATESVEVSEAGPEMTPPSAAGNLMARNNLPPSDAPAIEKAKPALPEKEVDEQEQKSKADTVPGTARLQGRNGMSAARLASTTTESVAPHVAWSITGGILQRSLDSGQSWQEALHPDHPLLCYASHDEDVWAGGQAGTLFHSANGGVTWVQGQPSIQTPQLSSDITHLELRNNELRNNEFLKNEAQNDALRRDGRDGVRHPAEVVLPTRHNEIWSTAPHAKTCDNNRPAPHPPTALLPIPPLS